MTFLSLLTKEMRLRMRRERTIWIVIAYILFMGLLGWFAVNSYSNAATYNNSNSALSSAGIILYYLLSQLQLFLIIFITPSFTSTAINGEKERQTYDLLLCSRLSPFSLLSGKLLAGLANALLLVAASAPLFSLVFFFGGVGPVNIAEALIVFVVTTLLTGTLGIFCSTVFQRPAISTAVAYMLCLLWVGLPILIPALSVNQAVPHASIAAPGPAPISGSPAQTTQPSFLMETSPITALTNTYPGGSNVSYYAYNPLLVLVAAFSPYGVYNAGTGLATTHFILSAFRLATWQAYALLSIGISALLFLISMFMLKPGIPNRLRDLVPLKRNEEEGPDDAEMQGATTS
jgi:ABC-type transport system involved in multi-copper enzyme maturation permease subunit